MKTSWYEMRVRTGTLRTGQTCFSQNFETLPRSLESGKKKKEKPMACLTVSFKSGTWQISEKPENSPSLEHFFNFFRIDDGSRLFVWFYENPQSRVHIPNLNLPVLFFGCWKRERERTAPQVIRLVLISFSILTGYTSAISELRL